MEITMKTISAMIKGKIVLLPFPFDNLSVAKMRPAVCLTEPIGPHNHIVLAFITSQIPPDILETDFFVYAMDHDRNFTDGRLRNAYQGGDLKLFPGCTPHVKLDNR